MDTVIVCDDPSISLQIRGSLKQLGIVCGASHDGSRSSAPNIVPRSDDRAAMPVVFFGSLRFAPDDLVRLKEVCSAEREQRKVVAVGPAQGPDVILQTIRCGAVDYLDISSNFDGELASLLDRIKSSRNDASHIGRLFTVISPVGGTGASLLATNLAAAMARGGVPCGLLDFQLRGSDLAWFLRASPRHTVLSLADKSQHLDRSMFEQSLIKHESGIHLLAGPEPYSDYRAVSPQVVQKIVHLARSSFANVVVDLEDCEHAEQVRTLAASDRIIIPLRLDYVSLCRTRKCIDYLTRSNVPRDHITPVATRVGQAKELPLARVEEVLGMALSHRIGDDPSAANASINLGVPLLIGAPKSKVAQQIARLADDLIGRCSAKTASAPQRGPGTGSALHWLGLSALRLGRA